MTDLTGVSQLLNKVSDDPVLRTALDRAISSYWKKRKQVMERYPYVKELADEVRRIKEWSIDHMDKLLDKAIVAVEAKGGKAYVAETAEEARKIVGELVGT
ncbi:MAG: lactate utilization protein, partial [Candidatus Korarchaeota archaeon]|nr:lactate utilization protein [Candidatus Korarchaeota archaeon]